jgi:hypothetical protein
LGIINEKRCNKLKKRNNEYKSKLKATGKIIDIDKIGKKQMRNA